VLKVTVAELANTGLDESAVIGHAIETLVFTDGGSNRSADAIRAIREACRGSAFNPAGVDDPRCPGGARK
jgi:hypothetical protein